MANLDNLDDVLNDVEEKVKKLINSPHCECKEIPNEQGVYLIYNQNKEVIYVGKSKNLSGRINKKHISGSATTNTSAFRKQLVGKYGLKAGKDLRQWIIDNCQFSYIEISDFDLCNAVESIAILTLRARGHKLLNHLVDE